MPDRIIGSGPRRVRVEGDLFHPRIPPGALYVGRSGPGLPASPYANPFALRRRFGRTPLRVHLDQALTELGMMTARTLASPGYDTVMPGTALVAVTAYRSYLAARPDLIEAAETELRGCDLACWCKLADPCHTDPLLEVANG